MFSVSIRQRHLISLAVAFAALATAAVAQQAVPTRDEIPEKYRWDLTTIYPTTAAWEADFAKAEKDIELLAKLEAQPLDSADALALLMTQREDTSWLVSKLVVYAYQSSDLDQRNNAALELRNRAGRLNVRLSEATAWIEPKLLTLSQHDLQRWMGESDTLAVYHHYLQNVLRQKQHTLPPDQERLIAMAGNIAGASRETYEILKNGEMEWPTMEGPDGAVVQLSPARFGKFIRSDDGRVRGDAFDGTMAAYRSLQNTYATTLSGAIQANVFYAKARGFDTPIEATMFPDNLPLSVYTNLVDTLNEHLPLMYRWADIRARAMGVEQLHDYDLYQPLVTGENEDIAYDDAVQIVQAALQPLGEEYGATIERGFNSRWIDVYETQGKRPGGYSWGSYDTNPFILLNYNGTMREVSTIAHEMGHSMHSYLTHKHQPKVYGNYSYFVAEVAAIFNEILLEDYLLKNAESREEKLRLLNEQIDNFRATVFRQTMFAEFEYAANELANNGEALTAEKLNKLYLDTFHKYWGPRLVRNEDHGVYWARIPHFYRNHYVYRYATSYCAAAALAERVLNEEPGAIEAYLGFLKSGSSAYPLEILRRAGVDMTTKAPIEAAMRRFEHLLDEFEKLNSDAEVATAKP
jgi:oligoendopeptidase F